MMYLVNNDVMQIEAIREWNIKDYLYILSYKIEQSDRMELQRKLHKK